MPDKVPLRPPISWPIKATQIKGLGDNLSSISSPSTARENLGLYFGYSSSVKPVPPSDGCIFIEMDTITFFVSSNGNWCQITQFPQSLPTDEDTLVDSDMAFLQLKGNNCPLT